MTSVKAMIMAKISFEEILDYARENYGLDIKPCEGGQPMTFKKLFGVSFAEELSTSGRLIHDNRNHMASIPRD